MRTRRAQRNTNPIDSGQKTNKTEWKYPFTERRLWYLRDVAARCRDPQDCNSASHESCRRTAMPAAVGAVAPS